MRSYKKLIIVMACGVGATFALYLFLLKPYMEKVNTLFNEATAKQTEYQAILDQILVYQSSQVELDSVNDRELLANSILERNTLQEVIEELEAGAAKAGVSEQLKIQETLDPKGKPRPTKPVIQGLNKVDDIPYTVTVSGNYLAIVRFMQYLEHLPHFTEVTSISLNAGVGETLETGQILNAETMTGFIDAVFMVRKESR